MGARAERRRRRRRLAVGGAFLAAGLVLVAVAAAAVFSTAGGSSPRATGAASALAAPTTSAPPPPTTTVAPTPSNARTLRLVRTVVGDITPKSVVSSGTGFVTAQNMMYRHSVTVYDADGNLVATIPDSVDLAAFGIAGHPGITRGAPVEAAFTPDRRFLYATNYSMYGTGFGPEGSDSCVPSQRFDDSFVYRIDMKTKAIDQVIPVGAVPKYVEVTPDGRYVLVTNWCSYDLSVIDATTARPIARIPLGAWPRGIAVDPGSKTAYIAVMGDNAIATVDLVSMTVTGTKVAGVAPRHLVMDPSGAFLYVTLSGEGLVTKIDLRTGVEVARARTGSSPRSMALASDGLSLYVVNYDSSTIAKLGTTDLGLLQTLATNEHPVGVAYEPTKGRLWVAGYGGSLQVYDDL